MSDTSFPFTMPIYCAGKQVREIEGRCDCNSDSTIDPIIYDLDDKAVIPTDDGHITKRAVESFLWGRYRDRIDECMSNAIKSARWQARADAMSERGSTLRAAE